MIIKINKRELRNKMIIMAIAVILAITIIEAGLRIALPQKLYNECYDQHHPDGQGVEVELHSHYGWYNKPNYYGCAYNPDTNKIIHKTHNAQGMRLLNNVTKQKPSNITRIALIGDSFVYGSNLDDTDTIAYQMQERLGSSYEVLPFASIGYGTDQELLVLKEEALQYEPDIVMLFLYQNDYSNSIATVQNYADKPMFILNLNNYSLQLVNYPTDMKWQQGNGDTIEPMFKDQPIRKFMLSHSHAYSLWQHKKQALFNLFKKKPQEKYYTAYTDSEQWSNEIEYRDNMNYGMIMVLSLIQEMSNGDYQFIVVNVPSKLNVLPEYQARFFERYTGITEQQFNFQKQSSIMSNNLGMMNITFIDLALIADDEFFMKNDAHWSKDGVDRTIKMIEKVKQ